MMCISANQNRRVRAFTVIFAWQTELRGTDKTGIKFSSVPKGLNAQARTGTGNGTEQKREDASWN